MFFNVDIVNFTTKVMQFLTVFVNGIYGVSLSCDTTQLKYYD